MTAESKRACWEWLIRVSISKSMKSFAVTVLQVIVLTEFFMALIGFWGIYNGVEHSIFGYMIDMATHYQLHYAVVAFWCLLPAILLRQKVLTGALVIVLVLSAVTLKPYIKDPSFLLPFHIASTPDAKKIIHQESEPEATSFRVLQFNVLGSNTNFTDGVNYIEAVNADIVALEEVSSGWESALTKLKPQYPYSHYMVREDSYGLAILSKHPLKNLRWKYPGQLRKFGFLPVPVLMVDVVPKQETLLPRFTAVVVHALPPVSPEHFEARFSQFAELAELISESTESLNQPLVVAGDFNVTPWSPYFNTFLNHAELIDTQAEKGVQTSWPAHVPAWWRVPIDHVLFSGDRLKLTSRVLGPALGSDHLPVIADFEVTYHHKLKRDKDKVDMKAKVK